MSERNREESNPEKRNEENSPENSDGGPEVEGEATTGPIWKGKPKLNAFYRLFASGGLALFCMTVALLTLPIPSWAAGLLIPASFFVVVPPFPLRLAWTFVLTRQEAKSEFRLWVGRSKSAPLNKVTDVVVEQGPIARLLGFGSVRMDTAGTSFRGVKFWGVERPFELRDEIEGVVDERKYDEG